jgi:hypothetical protein
MVRKILYRLILIVVLLVPFTGCRKLDRILRGPASAGADRSPAAIQKVFDFSYLEGSSFQMAAKRRLYNSMDVEKQGGDIVIEMGNFVLLNDKKEKEFACGFYDRFMIRFEAEGISGDGEKPTLAIESQCQLGENINFLVPIRIPVAKITSEEPGNAEYKFFDSEHPVTIKFSNTAATWPRKWILKDIKMIHSKMSARVLTVAPSELAFEKPRPVSMNW